MNLTLKFSIVLGPMTALPGSLRVPGGLSTSLTKLVIPPGSHTLWPDPRSTAPVVIWPPFSPLLCGPLLALFLPLPFVQMQPNSLPLLFKTEGLLTGPWLHVSQAQFFPSVIETSP